MMNREEWTEREKIYACWLCNFPDMGNGQLHRLVERCGGPEGTYLADKEMWGQVLSPKQVDSLARYTADWRPEAEYRKMQKEGIELVTIRDEGYPERLRNIPDAPYGLFVRGRLSEEDAPAVAVIGARECSEYGRYVAKELGAALGRRGVTVVSGMAKGIDGISQEAALEVGGYSIGVLGCGVDICYPAQNRALYSKLTGTGAVISTYPMGTPALSRNFPPRNRIVSGLADAVVVVEARVKSGTLITVDMALEQGREVYVIPGRVTDRLSDGCNRLMKQGAGILLSPESFLEEIWQLWEARKEGGPPKTGSTECAGRNRFSGRGRKGGISESGSMEDRDAGSMPGDEGKEDVRGSGRQIMAGVRKGKRDVNTFLEQPQTAGLSEELKQVYETLDFSPRTPTQIQQSLSDGYSEKQVITCLMQLCMEGFAVQISPGHFCCRRN